MAINYCAKGQDDATSPGGSKRNFLERVSFKKEGNHHWVDELSKEIKTSEGLIEAIVAEIEAQPNYYQNVKEILFHLSKIMKFFYKNLQVEIKPFGSCHTKLALESSDVDIYLDFGGNLPEPPEKLLKTLKNKVRKYGYFISSIPIFARVPIVHCVHRNRVSCDISFINALGVYNSHLIKFLVSLDKRVRPLILIVKYLMKNQGLLGQNSLTSFALIILIVFFLQQLENPLIPSIHYLQNLASEKIIIANWDTSFTENLDFLPAVNNQLSIPELLKKFFEFYSGFEFGFYVISVFTGKAYLKPIFLNADLIPEEFYLYKKNLADNESYKFDINKVLCTQGPFNHGNNITRNVTQKSLQQFQAFCSSSVVVGQELLDGEVVEENKIKYLVKLFNDDLDEPKNKRLKKEDIIIYVGEKFLFNDCNCTEQGIRNEWTKYIFQSIKTILCEIMKCDVFIGDETAEEKLIKCELHNFELVTKKRNEAKSDLEFPPDMSDIRREEIVSSYLCDTILKNSEKVSLKFEIGCSVRKKPTSFCMYLKSEEQEKAKQHLIQQVFHFIRNNFPKWLK